MMKGEWNGFYRVNLKVADIEEDLENMPHAYYAKTPIGYLC
jgi:hypothetical protein